MLLNIVAGDAAGATTLVLGGELDLATAAEFEANIDHLLAGGHNRILVDVHALAFCDSIGLSAMVRGSKRCRAGGGWLRIVRPHGQVAHVLQISGLVEFLSSGVPAEDR